MFQCLQKLGVCMSHQITSSLVDSLGVKHDDVVIEWKEALQNNIEMVRIIIIMHEIA